MNGPVSFLRSLASSRSALFRTQSLGIFEVMSDTLVFALVCHDSWTIIILVVVGLLVLGKKGRVRYGKFDHMQNRKRCESYILVNEGECGRRHKRGETVGHLPPVGVLSWCLAVMICSHQFQSRTKYGHKAGFFNDVSG
jgi:hypothetical protein